MVNQSSITLTALALVSWLYQLGPVVAEQVEFRADICSQQTISKSWASQHQGTGHAQLRMNPITGVMSVQLDVRGVSLDELAPAGPKGALGAIHIHNYPQGGPDFFVQQLPGDFIPTDNGFRFALKDWPMVAPAGGANVSVAFVISEVLSGNAYIGLHSKQILCANKLEEDIACAAPATALSGSLVGIKEYARNECHGE